MYLIESLLPMKLLQFLSLSVHPNQIWEQRFPTVRCMPQPLKTNPGKLWVFCNIFLLLSFVLLQRFYMFEFAVHIPVYFSLAK